MKGESAFSCIYSALTFVPCLMHCIFDVIPGRPSSNSSTVPSHVVINYCYQGPNPR